VRVAQGKNRTRRRANYHTYRIIGGLKMSHQKWGVKGGFGCLVKFEGSSRSPTGA
jgi:hypothetical protein